MGQVNLPGINVMLHTRTYIHRMECYFPVLAVKNWAALVPCVSIRFPVSPTWKVGKTITTHCTYVRVRVFNQMQFCHLVILLCSLAANSFWLWTSPVCSLCCHDCSPAERKRQTTSEPEFPKLPDLGKYLVAATNVLYQANKQLSILAQPMPFTRQNIMTLFVHSTFTVHFQGLFSQAMTNSVIANIAQDNRLIMAAIIIVPYPYIGPLDAIHTEHLWVRYGSHGTSQTQRSTRTYVHS